MPGPDSLLTAFDPLLAYGPVPGVELIPYFLGLLAWVGLALVSIFLSPITALLRRLRRGWSAPPAGPRGEPKAPAPEPAGESHHDGA